MKVTVTRRTVYTINPTHKNIVRDLQQQRRAGTITGADFHAELLAVLDQIAEGTHEIAIVDLIQP